MTTPLKYTNLGVMTPTQIRSLWVFSHLSQNVPCNFWVNLVLNLGEFNPNWYMFTNDIWHVRIGETNYYFQKGLYDAANGTGLGLLGEDFINEMILPDLDPLSYSKILETIAKATGEGHSTTNILLKDITVCDKVLTATSDFIYVTANEDFDGYVKRLSSKRRSNIKKSIELSQGLSYHVYDCMKPSQLAWAVSHTVNNFGDSGAGEDNGFVLESSLHQWTLLSGLNRNVKFVDVWDTTGTHNRRVAMLAFTERYVHLPQDIVGGEVVYDFYSFALDRNYQGVGSVVLLQSVLHIMKDSPKVKDIGVMLNTANKPGEDYDPYVSYKKNVANRTITTASGMASHPDRDLPEYYKNVFNTKLGEWV